MSAKDIIKAIMSGEVDEDLDNIYRAYVARHKMLRQQKAFVTVSEIKNGDRVRLVKITPKYLNGVVVTVVRKYGNDLYVDFGKDQWDAGRYMGLKNIRVSAASVEIL